VIRRFGKYRGVPIARIRALDLCRAAGRVFAGSARVLTQRLSLSPRRRFDGGGQLRAPSPETGRARRKTRPCSCAPPRARFSPRSERRVRDVLALERRSTHYAGSRSHPARRGLRSLADPILREH
jgi:hypothetical protein